MHPRCFKRLIHACSYWDCANDGAADVTLHDDFAALQEHGFDLRYVVKHAERPTLGAFPQAFTC